MKDKAELIDLVNERLGELYNLCEKAGLSLIASVYSEALGEPAVFIGGKPQDFMVIVKEVILSLADDASHSAEAELKRSLAKNEYKTLVKIMLEEVVTTVLDTIDAGGDTRDNLRYSPVNQEVLTAISTKLELEINETLNAILVDSHQPLNKDLIAKAKLAVSGILEKYFLADKIGFAINIAPDGVAEVSFKTKSKAEGYH